MGRPGCEIRAYRGPSDSCFERSLSSRRRCFARRHNGDVTNVSSTPLVPPVLVLGAHIAALGVLRVLAGHRIPTFVVDATTNVIIRSRWYRAPGRRLAETADSEILAEYLRGLDIERAVMIPCSDQWAVAVAGLPDDLKARFPASLPPRSAVEDFVDKDRFRGLTDRLDLPRPRSIPIVGVADLDGVDDADLREGFLKPTESARHNRAFKTKGFFIASRDDARRRVAEAMAVGITYTLQEWIPGDMASTILIDGFVDRTGEIKAMVARRRVRMDPPKLANTCSDVTIPLADVESCLPALRTLLEATAYRGIFNVEFKYDARDGRFKIIELNPRPFWLIGHIERAGVDLPWMAYLDALELPVPDPGPYQVGRYGMYEIVDATAIVRAWTHLRRPEGPVLGPWLRGDRALFWFRDPMPAIEGIGQIIGRRLGRRQSAT
jgi:D-aspartate ligase